MTKIWHYCFYNELRVTPSEHPSTYEGHPLPHGVIINPLTGKNLTEYMKRLLKQIGLNFSSSAEIQTIRDIKQKHCYVGLDYEQEIKNYQQDNHQYDKDYELSDGQQITVSSQRFRYPEALFKPILIEKGMPVFHEITYESILRCQMGLRKDLYNNIVMNGENTMFPGISERLSKEVGALAPSTIKVKVFAPQQRKFLAWIGGSILSFLLTFRHMWITRAEYQETGVKSFTKMSLRQQ